MKEIHDMFSYLLPLTGAICVIVLTYYASKWYARKMGPLSGGKHIKVIDRQMIGKTGSILIIDVEGVQYLVGANEQSIRILRQLKDPIPVQSAASGTKPSFRAMIKPFLHKEEEHE
jgi:flagellar protein FliO/FliZ